MRKEIQQIMLDQLNSQMIKNYIDSLPHTVYKKINFRFIIHLTIKSKSIKQLEEHTGEQFCKLVVFFLEIKKHKP